MTYYTTKIPSGRKVEAIQFTGNFEEIEAFIGGDAEWRYPYCVVATPQGPMRVSQGYWIVRDEPLGFQVISDLTFQEIYKKGLD